MTVKIFTDGGSRGNPGNAACGFVVFGSSADPIYSQGDFLGVGTNNEAEYQGFAKSLDWLLSTKDLDLTQATQIIWHLDSKLVVEQLLKRWKIKEPRLQEFATQIWLKLAQLPCEYSLTHVPRAQNALADAVVNKTLDSN